MNELPQLIKTGSTFIHVWLAPERNWPGDRRQVEQQTSQIHFNTNATTTNLEIGWKLQSDRKHLYKGTVLGCVIGRSQGDTCPFLDQFSSFSSSFRGKLAKIIEKQGVKNFTRWLVSRMTIPTSHDHSHLMSTLCDHSNLMSTLREHSHLTWPFQPYMHVRWGSPPPPKVTLHDHSNLVWPFSPCITIPTSHQPCKTIPTLCPPRVTMHDHSHLMGMSDGVPSTTPKKSPHMAILTLHDHYHVMWSFSPFAILCETKLGDAE